MGIKNVIALRSAASFLSRMRLSATDRNMSVGIGLSTQRDEMSLRQINTWKRSSWALAKPVGTQRLIP